MDTIFENCPVCDGRGFVEVLAYDTPEGVDWADCPKCAEKMAHMEEMMDAMERLDTDEEWYQARRRQRERQAAA